MSFEEIEHTADCAIRAWAPDLPSLFAAAATGMYAVAGVKLGKGQGLKRNIRLQAQDHEGLLVAFLTELVYALEQEERGFVSFDLQISNGQLEGQMDGRALETIAKPIKAVTYHNLKIRETERGHEVELVFDV